MVYADVALVPEDTNLVELLGRPPTAKLGSTTTWRLVDGWRIRTGCAFVVIMGAFDAVLESVRSVSPSPSVWDTASVASIRPFRQLPLWTASVPP